MKTANERRRALARVALLATLIGACATPEKLNSDRIRDRFGSFGIEVVSQDVRNRRSSLFSTENGTRTARTEALVVFEHPVIDAVAETHRAIIAGAPIGATFRSEGWQVQKTTVYVGEVAIEDLQSAVARRMGLAAPDTLAMHVYELHLEKSAGRIFYATIIELHHPDFLTRDDLLDIYPVDASKRLEARDIDALAALVLTGA